MSVLTWVHLRPRRSGGQRQSPRGVRIVIAGNVHYYTGR